MKTPYPHAARRTRGSIAVECAIILPIFILMISTMLFFGRVFWHYTVAVKAAHDATRFLAAASLREMRSTAGGSEVPIVGVAMRIVRDEVEELNPGGVVGTNVACRFGTTSLYWDACYGIETPSKVRVRVTVAMSDPFLDGFTMWLNNGDPIVLKAVAASDYMGN